MKNHVENVNIFPPKCFLLSFNILLIFPLLSNVMKENYPSSAKICDFGELPWGTVWFPFPVASPGMQRASGWERAGLPCKTFLEPTPFQNKNLTLRQKGAWNYLHLLPLYILCQNNEKLRASLMKGWCSVLSGLLLAIEGNEGILFRVPIDLALH